MIQTLKKVDDIFIKIYNDEEHKGYYIGFYNSKKLPIIEIDQGSIPNKNDVKIWYKIVYTNEGYNLYKIENE